MTVPRWLLPVLAAVAAVAVAVAGTLIGLRLATAAEPEAAPAEAQVLPVAEQFPEEAAEEVGQAIADGELSAGDLTTGSATSIVPAVDADDAVDAALREAVESIASEEDPGVGSTDSGAEVPLPEGLVEILDPPTDPCVYPEESDGEVTCPDGTTAVVLPSVAAPPLQIVGAVRPPTFETAAERDPVVYCPATAPAEGAMPWGVGSNQPIDLEVSWWPTDDVEDVQAFAGGTTPEAEAAWNEGLATAEVFGGAWSRPQHCGEFGGLEPGRSYEARAVGTSRVTGEVAEVRWSFALETDPTIPPVRVVPLTDNVLLVSAPHTEEQDVEVSLWIEDDFDGGCAPGETPAGGVYEQPTFTAPVDARVSDEYNEVHGWSTEYDRRWTQAFSVAEGATLRLCVLWTTGADFGDGIAVERRWSQQILSPDRLVPHVDLLSLDVDGDLDRNALQISGATREGYACGSWTGPAEGGSVDDVGSETVCDLENVVSAVRASASGDLVIRAYHLEGGDVGDVERWDDREQTGVHLRLARTACRGDCEPPASTRALLPLPTGDDDVATLGISWTQGRQNGSPDWVLGFPDETIGTASAPTYPQLGTDVEPRVGFDRAGRALVEFDLVADRDVRYRVEIEGADPRGACPDAQEGSLEAGVATTVVFERLCVGTFYSASVRLTAEDGSVSRWAADETGPTRWGGSFFSPPIPVDVAGTLAFDLPEEYVEYGTWAMITVNGDSLYDGVADDYVGCLYAAERPAGTRVVVPVDEDVLVTSETFALEVRIVARTGIGGHPYDRCRHADWIPDLVVVLRAELVVTEVVGATVTLESADSAAFPAEARFTLRRQL